MAVPPQESIYQFQLLPVDGNPVSDKITESPEQIIVEEEFIGRGSAGLEITLTEVFTQFEKQFPFLART